MKRAYQHWFVQYAKLPKPVRYTLGAKIHEQYFTAIELALRAQYKHGYEKQKIIENLSEEFDSLKWFMTLLWEMKAIDHKQFAVISEDFGKIGKQIGGWKKSVDIQKRRP